MGPGTEVGDGAADRWMGVGEGRREEELDGERTGREKGQVGVSDGFQVSGIEEKPWAGWKRGLRLNALDEKLGTGLRK